MGVAQVQALEEEIVTAIEAGDRSTAIRKLQALKVRLIAMPDAMQQSAQLRWDRRAIDSLILSLRQEIVGAAGGPRQTLVTYKRPST